MKNYAKNEFMKSIDALKFEIDNRVESLESLAADVLTCFDSGGKIAFVGNGGSAAEAMHLAAEFTGKCLIDHKPLPAMCLNESQSSLTAIANDYGQEKVFSRHVEAFLSEGDILIALSTSGKSQNIIQALEVAKIKKVRTLLWTGKKYNVDTEHEFWSVNSESTPRIQEIHLIWGHLLAEIVEKSIEASANLKVNP